MTTSRFDLTGKTALITGASSGLGAHFARVLAAAGARVVLAARRADRLSALVDELKQQGFEAMAVTMDVTDADSVDAGFSAAEQAFGVCDILVLSLIHISEPTRRTPISYAVFCLKKGYFFNDTATTEIYT